MVVLILPGIIAIRMGIAMGIHKKLYMPLGASQKEDVRTQWEAAASGAQDLGQKAIRLRAAVIAHDSCEIEVPVFESYPSADLLA